MVEMTLWIWYFVVQSRRKGAWSEYTMTRLSTCHSFMFPKELME